MFTFYIYNIEDSEEEPVGRSDSSDSIPYSRGSLHQIVHIDATLEWRA